MVYASVHFCLNSRLICTTVGNKCLTWETHAFSENVSTLGYKWKSFNENKTTSLPLVCLDIIYIYIYIYLLGRKSVYVPS